MEEKVEEQPGAASPPAKTSAPAPVMDIKPPQSDIQPALQPVAVKSAPPKDTDEIADTEQPADTPKPPEHPAKKTDAKKAGPLAPKAKNGVGAAIAGTVIIVLGLAALATYAFLKTQN